MMKKVLIVAMIIAIIATAMIMLCTTAKSEAYIPSETVKIIKEPVIVPIPQYTEPTNLAELQIILEDCVFKMTEEATKIEKAKAQGASDDDFSVKSSKSLQEEFKKLYNEHYAKYYEKFAEEAKWEKKSAEYPNATYIWRYLKKQGYNNYVAAGIMGNMMAEVGGQTLKIQYQLKGSGYYGICQWSRSYKKVWNTGLAEQCQFLQDTIRYELNTYGYAYRKHFNYEKFCELTNEKDAALAFAKCYERCASFSYKIRQKNATVALNYFTK